MTAAPDGFSINLPGGKDIQSALDAIAGGLEYSYSYFGQNATVLAGPGIGPERVLGTMDSSGDTGGQPDVADAWDAFTTAWGQVMDEGVGGVNKLSWAMNQTAIYYQDSDIDAADAQRLVGDANAVLTEAPGTGFYNLSGLTTLVPPSPSDTSGTVQQRWANNISRLTPPTP